MKLNLETKCEHKVVKYLGKLKAPKGLLVSVGRCYYCKERVLLTEKYRKIVGDVYEINYDKLI